MIFGQTKRFTTLPTSCWPKELHIELVQSTQYGYFVIALDPRETKHQTWQTELGLIAILAAHSFITSRSILLLPGDGEHIVSLCVEGDSRTTSGVKRQIYRKQRRPLDVSDVWRPRMIAIQQPTVTPIPIM